VIFFKFLQISANFYSFLPPFSANLCIRLKSRHSIPDLFSARQRQVRSMMLSHPRHRPGKFPLFQTSQAAYFTRLPLAIVAEICSLPTLRLKLNLPSE
jgi:hypothetical protein